MKFRWVLAAGLAAAAVATSVLAQSDPIATRMALMKGNNDNARNVSLMIRGQQPFDPAKVDAAFAQWAETAQKLPAQFPPDSKTGQKSRAAPAIWDHKQDFDAKAAAFGQGRRGEPRQGAQFARGPEGGFCARQRCLR